MTSKKKNSRGSEKVIRRRRSQVLGLFIDGTGLDRATRRISRKVDLSSLVKGVSSGVKPTIARYYTIIPYEDDSRQRAFLDAVHRAGLTVIVKRLPPKGVSRQVTVDIHIATDIMAFALGQNTLSGLDEYQIEEPYSGTSAMHDRAQRGPEGGIHRIGMPAGAFRAEIPARGSEDRLDSSSERTTTEQSSVPAEGVAADVARRITVVCPSRDLSYAIARARELNVDTTTADFGNFSGGGDLLRSAAKWIDLSDSETIWRE